jgi:hypothetical protein
MGGDSKPEVSDLNNRTTSSSRDDHVDGRKYFASDRAGLLSIPSPIQSSVTGNNVTAVNPRGVEETCLKYIGVAFRRGGS